MAAAADPYPISLEALAGRVDEWCSAHDVVPAAGQAAEALSDRTVRYYRTLGLMDGPEPAGGYGEKHFLQLTAVRVLQARGLALRRIRELLHGRGLAELRELQRRALREQAAQAANALPRPLPTATEELWRMIPLDPDFTLASRRGEPITEAQRAAILRVLRGA
ncbi:MAG: MerR family transcriptional regulator [Verrucomicrobia bacterium]|nr:MerR family transcriptional regulator [Verrucomicrobiota bacterium]